uniref:NB-ARC domain-containing protein n=1 Tax=Salix viminalis TaxID=40686 RepID=A0A6N2MJV2_SALVM
MAGVGKTKLLKHLHNDLLQSQDNTHRLYWVPVSQNCSNERLQNLIAKSIGVDLSSEDDGLHTSVNVPEEIKEATLGRNGSSHMPPSEDLANLSSEDDGLRRSVKLSKELLRQNKKWILILDNLWDCFEPHVVGIAELNKGCKMIVATRSKEVFLKMASRSIIKVDTLSHEEAVSLFMMKHGQDIELSP